MTACLCPAAEARYTPGVRHEAGFHASKERFAPVRSSILNDR